jgi:hypothetical protein
MKSGLLQNAHWAYFGKEKSRFSIVRSPESGVRSLESGVRSLQSGGAYRLQTTGYQLLASYADSSRKSKRGVCSPESGVRSLQSGVRSPESGVWRRLQTTDYRLPTTGLEPLRGAFLVAAKQHQPNPGAAGEFLTDAVYGLDDHGFVLDDPFTLPAEQDQNHFNDKLVQDANGIVCQVSLQRGLVDLQGNEVLVGSGSCRVDEEPSYHERATVYLGIQGTPDPSWQRPLLDAAFHKGFVYVTPVVVQPDSHGRYVAAARLLLGGDSPGYSVEQIFYDPPDPNDNRDFTQLREVEVDPDGRVYVLNCHYLNRGDTLWVYDPNGQLACRRELEDLGITAPTGLCVSWHDPARLYVASAENSTDAASVKLYVLSARDLSPLPAIEIHNMGHITDIADDPATGTVCAVGFLIPRIPSVTELQAVDFLQRETFYLPRCAVIPYDNSGPVEANCPTDASGGSDLALPLSVIHRN